jgi:hypothetical protein
MPTVYILTNPAMPGLVKIGCTDRGIEERLRELSAGPGVPVAFECFLAVEVTNHRAVERAFHDAFGDRRLNPKREFFRLSPDRPAALLRLFQQNSGARDVTPMHDVVDSPEEQRALDRERRRKANFRFGIVGIKPGTVLHAAFDENVTSKVVSDRDVEFRGEIESLSSAAMIVAKENGYNCRAIAGPSWWKYDGKTLAELRDEVEDDSSVALGTRRGRVGPG